jgi:hypothetical protein
VAGILEKSKRLRKAFFIVKKLPISHAQPKAALKPRNVGRAILAKVAPRDLPVQNRYNLGHQQGHTAQEQRKDDGAPAGTVVPADANRGVLPNLI